MKYLKNLSIIMGIMIGIILVSTFLMTTLNYFNVFGKSFVSILKILIIVIALFVGGYLIGKKSDKKGWLEGLKLGIITTIIILLFNLLGLNNKFEFKNIMYYGILIISAIFGSMIGINKVKN